MNTFEIKVTVLSLLGENATLADCKEAYEWLMEEVVKEDKEPVVLRTIQ